MELQKLLYFRCQVWPYTTDYIRYIEKQYIALIIDYVLHYSLFFFLGLVNACI